MLCIALYCSICNALSLHCILIKLQSSALSLYFFALSLYCTALLCPSLDFQCSAVQCALQCARYRRTFRDIPTLKGHFSWGQANVRPMRYHQRHFMRTNSEIKQLLICADSNQTGCQYAPWSLNHNFKKQMLYKGAFSRNSRATTSSDSRVCMTE